MKNRVLMQNLFFSRTNDFLNIYLPKQVVRSKHTIKAYQDGLTVFRRYITDIKKISIRLFRFSDCTHDFLLDYMAFLKGSGFVESTCNNRIAAIRAYLWYVSNMDVSMNSIAIGASKVPFLREVKGAKEIISEDTFTALMSAPERKSKIGIRDRAIMILLYDSAIRVSELLELTLSSLNLNASIPYIRVHGKGDKERVVSLTDKTAAHLRYFMAVYHPVLQADRPLFYTVIKENLSAMSTSNVERLIKKYAEKIRPEHPDLPEKVHPHMFRRTRATNLYQNGVELVLVARILGHASTQTTRLYATPSMEMLKEAMGAKTEGIPDEEPLWMKDETELARLCGLR